MQPGIQYLAAGFLISAVFSVFCCFLCFLLFVLSLCSVLCEYFLESSFCWELFFLEWFTVCSTVGNTDYKTEAKCFRNVSNEKLIYKRNLIGMDITEIIKKQ